MITRTSTDPEGAVKDWVNGGAVPLLAGHAWLGIPSGNPVMPLLDISRVGGGFRPDGLEDVVLVLDVWAKSKLAASDASRQLTAALVMEAEGMALNAGTWCHGVSGVSTVWLPDPTAKLVRYSLTVSMTVEARELP